jgi:hypothetical protein
MLWLHKNVFHTSTIIAHKHEKGNPPIQRIALARKDAHFCQTDCVGLAVALDATSQHLFNPERSLLVPAVRHDEIAPIATGTVNAISVCYA